MIFLGIGIGELCDIVKTNGWFSTISQEFFKSFTNINLWPVLLDLFLTRSVLWFLWETQNLAFLLTCFPDKELKLKIS